MWSEFAQGAIIVVIAVSAALLVAWTTAWLVRRLALRRRSRLLAQLYRSCRRAWTAVLVVTSLYVAIPSLMLDAQGQVRHALELLLIAVGAWLLLKVLFVAEDTAFAVLSVDVANNRRVRRLRTQIGILRQFTTGLVIIVAIAAMLMTFSLLRTFGASLLASAGVVGAIAGFAAHANLSNVFAGLQLALTDALRYDDVVVVENEWGRVEELTLTHVVVRLWDERRLVLPTTYFTTTPFQNWTRNEARVLGSVELHVGYNAPMMDLRAEARRIIERSPLWDRRDWVLQVVDSTPWSMIIRVLASAPDGPSSWDLRCDIREGLIKFLHREHPDALPRPGALGAFPQGAVPDQKQRSDRRPTGPSSAPAGNRTTFRSG